MGTSLACGSMEKNRTTLFDELEEGLDTPSFSLLQKLFFALVCFGIIGTIMSIVYFDLQSYFFMIGTAIVLIILFLMSRSYSKKSSKKSMDRFSL